MNLKHWLRHPAQLPRRIWHFFYERTHQSEPFLAPAAVRFLDRNLPRHGNGLEWGSGRSTEWLARRLASLVSVEHNAAWLEQVTLQLANSGITNVDYRFVPLDHPENEPTGPTYQPTPRYVALAEQFRDGSFDFVEVDGHYRQACVLAALPKVKPGGLLLVDDTNWLPLAEWGVPSDWPIVHQSTKINTTTSIWKCPDASTHSPASGGAGQP